MISGSWPGPRIPSPTPAELARGAPFPWQDARFYEYRNTGPGSAVAADVPQLTAAQADQYTVASYLAGWWPAPKGGAADWTEERGARNER